MGKYCTVPYFGFKAKPSLYMAGMSMIVLCLILDSRQNGVDTGESVEEIVLCLILDSRQNWLFAALPAGTLYCALFWIQGKTE